jgi:tripartite ATP-independent transporter DctP family solute receptor
MKKKSLIKSTFILTLFFMLIPGGSMAAEITLKLGHVAPVGPTTHDVSAKKFAERVAANTNGRVEVKVFGNSQFGNLMEHWGQLQTGAIDLFDQDVGAAFMAEPKPKNFIITLFPYVFESQEHFHNFVKSDLFKSMMTKVEKAANVKYLGYAGDRTPRGFTTTNKRVTTPDEIKGLKLRVPPVPPFVAAYKSWGANPTPIAAKEIYSALKSGMVMGMDQDLTMTYAAKYYEIQKYFIAVNYMRSGMGIWMNADKWASLPNDVQAAMLKSVQETEIYINEFTAGQMDEAKKGLTAEGVEIVYPDLTPWMQAAEKAVVKTDGKMWEKGLYDKVKALK